MTNAPNPKEIQFTGWGILVGTEIVITSPTREQVEKHLPNYGKDARVVMYYQLKRKRNAKS